MSKNTKLSLVSNLLLIIFGIIGFLSINGENNLFLFYTNDSNILCLLSAILYVLFKIIYKEKDLPFVILIIRYMASACLCLTFLTVVFYLAVFDALGSSNFINAYFNSLLLYLGKDSFLYYHLLCPIISFISFSFFEGDRRLNKKKTIYYAILPTLLYAIILVILNINGIVEGPYPFLMINNQEIYISIISFVVIFVIDYICARFILLLNQKYAPRRRIRK